MANILLLGAGGNAGINFTKCVQKEGNRVFGVDMNKYYLDSCNADVTLNLDFDKKLEGILQIIEDYKIDMIHAQPDPEVKWLLSQPSLSKYIFPHSKDLLEKFSNKMYCQSVWSKKHEFSTYSYLECCMNPNLFQEMSIKGGGKVWTRAIHGAGSKAALPVTSFQQAHDWINYWDSVKGINASDFMLCQYLPGKEYAVQTFWYEGQLIHSQQRERVAYFFGALMPSGQTSTPSVARITSDRDVYDTAYDAITSINPSPHGIYCVDLKRDIQNKVIPMEVNYGRFFTTSDFFAEVGVNTPSTYVQAFIGNEISSSIEKVKEPYYWVRGLDKEPKLLKY